MPLRPTRPALPAQASPTAAGRRPAMPSQATARPTAPATSNKPATPYGKTRPAKGWVMSSDTQFSWREIVEKADDADRHKDSLFPVVYIVSGGRKFRDSGPNGGVYAGDT